MHESVVAHAVEHGEGQRDVGEASSLGLCEGHGAVLGLVVVVQIEVVVTAKLRARSAVIY